MIKVAVTPGDGTHHAGATLKAEDLADLIEARIKLKIADQILVAECGHTLDWYLVVLCDGDPFNNPIDPATISETVDKLEDDLEDLDSKLDALIEEMDEDSESRS